jgi:hypothetical protein
VNRPTADDAREVHPYEFVTVKVYVPAASPEIVVLAPDPAVIVPPGSLVNVHEPAAGRPLKTTLPVGALKVGCVMVPITGGAGVGGCALIIALPDAEEVHPTAFVTVKVNVPAGIPDTVVLVPVAELEIPPGVLVRVQVPVAGNPFRTALPVATAHVGWVIVPIVGAAGVDGCELITALADTGDVHPEAFATM